MHLPSIDGNGEVAPQVTIKEEEVDFLCLCVCFLHDLKVGYVSFFRLQCLGKMICKAWFRWVLDKTMHRLFMVRKIYRKISSELVELDFRCLNFVVIFIFAGSMAAGHMKVEL